MKRIAQTNDNDFSKDTSIIINNNKQGYRLNSFSTTNPPEHHHRQWLLPDIPQALPRTRRYDPQPLVD